MADPYAGVGAAPDPYVGVGAAQPAAADPYAGVGAAPPAAPPTGLRLAAGVSGTVPNHSYASDELAADVAPFTTTQQHFDAERARGPSLNPVDWAKSTLEAGGDMFSMLTSPITAAFHAGIVHPAAELASRSGIPLYNPQVGLSPSGVPTYTHGPQLTQPQAEQQLEGDFGTALMALGHKATSARAATILDSVTAAKRSFDVDQSLGGTHSVASPFVKGLFSDRGVDTTPQSDPRPSKISPTTGDQVAINASDHAQYQQLLQTGSVDDIKDFFKGRNGPQPSWTDVNAWVDHRDGPPVSTNGQPGIDPSQQPDFNYNDEYNAHAEVQAREQNRIAVEDHVNNQMAEWHNAPNVEVVHGPEDINDPTIREQAIKEDGDGSALGFLGHDGTVRMFSGRITSPEMANAVLYHEGLGHYGLAEKFGDRLDQTLTSLLDRNVNQLSRDTDAWMKQNPGAYGGDRLRAAEEVLAERSQNGKIPSSWQDAVSSAVRQFGRKMGLKLAYNDAEVNHILAMAHDAVINGKSGARANGFQGSNKFMFLGPKAAKFNPRDSSLFRASDGRWRTEISDKEAVIKNPEGKTLGEVLHHPELFANYPELRDLPVIHEGLDPKYAGMYNVDNEIPGMGRHMMINSELAKSRPDLLKAVIHHETQHAIQDIEQYPAFKEIAATGGTEGLTREEYLAHPMEREARATDTRINLDQQTRRANPVQTTTNKFMRNAMGHEPVNPEHLDEVDRLKQDPRYWQDHEFRANVNELARTRFPMDASKATPEAFKYGSEAEARASGNKYMRSNQPDQHDPLFIGRLRKQALDHYQGIADFAQKILENPHATDLDRDRYVPMLEPAQRMVDQLKQARSQEDIINSLPKHMVDQLKRNTDYHQLFDHNEIFYHGTNKEFTNLKDVWGRGIAFATDKSEGQAYANLRAEKSGGSPRVVAAQLKYENPYIMDEPGHTNISPQEVQSIWDKGHDAIISPSHEGPTPGHVVIVKTPEQITQLPGDGNKYMRAGQLAPKDVASEAYDRLSEGYEPTSRSWDDAIQAAKDTALDTSKLKSTRSVGDLDKRLFQYNAAAKELNDNLVAAAQKIANGEELTDAEHADQIKNVAQFHYVLSRIENDSSQIARALNAMKAIDFSRNNLLGLQKALDDSGSTLSGLSDPDNMNKFLRQYKMLGNAKGGQTLVRDLSKPGWEKYALTLYRNMLLSGLGTHVKAPMDMSTGIALDLEDRLGAIPIGKIHDALQAVGLTKQGGMHGREPLGYLFGAMRAITDGSAWTKSMAAIVDPQSQTLRMSREAPAVLPGMAGKVTTLPTRLIAAQDAFFRAISTNAHLYGEGVARSLQEGGNLSWSDHLDRGVSYGQNPSDAMRATAVDRANKALLLSENPLTNFLERGKQIAGKKGTPDILDRAVTSIIDLLTPIIRVPANSLLSRVIARSPLSFLDPDTRSMFQAGGRQADIALSRTVVGTLKLGMMWAAADVTGNYLKGNNRKQAEASGWRPNSIHENGTYETGNQLAASVNPWDLHNSTATMVADIHEAYNSGSNQGQVGTALKVASARMMSDMYDQLWTGDVSRAMGMFSDNPADTGSATRVLGNIASSVAVPAIVAQNRAFTDPYQHDTSVPNSISGSIANQIQARIPGLSNSLPIRYSVYGEPLKTGQNIIGTHNWLTGGNRVPETNDPAEKELDRLNTRLASLKEPDDTSWPATLITPVQRKVTLDDGTKKALTPSEFEQYQQRAGRYIVQDVRQEMSTPEWQRMSDHDKVLAIKDIMSDQKANAREELFNTQ